MTANEIVNAIEMAFNRKHMGNGLIFKMASNGDSFYLVASRGNGAKPIQIRLSNHGTYLKTWVDMANKKDSTVRLIDPSFSINYSIVFIDGDNNLTSDCEGQPNCDNCKIPECVPQQLNGTTDKKHSYQVMQYVYDSSLIKMKYIQGFVNAIYQAIHSGKFIDPLMNAIKNQTDGQPIERKAKAKQLQSRFLKEFSIEQFRTILAESIKEVLDETLGVL